MELSMALRTGFGDIVAATDKERSFCVKDTAGGRAL